MSTTGTAPRRGHIWLDVVFDALLRFEGKLQPVVYKVLLPSLPKPAWQRLNTKMKMAVLARQTCGGWCLTVRAFRQLPMRAKPTSLKPGVEPVRTQQLVLPRDLPVREST